MEYVTQPIRTVPRFPKAAFSLSVLCTNWATGTLVSWHTICCGRYPSGGCYSVFKGEICSHLFAHEQPICVVYTYKNFQRIKGKKKAPATWPFFRSATSASRFAIQLFGGFICLYSLMEVHIRKAAAGFNNSHNKEQYQKCKTDCLKSTVNI